jgi:hypothetical protein
MYPKALRTWTQPGDSPDPIAIPDSWMIPACTRRCGNRDSATSEGVGLGKRGVLAGHVSRECGTEKPVEMTWGRNERGSECLNMARAPMI